MKLPEFIPPKQEGSEDLGRSGIRKKPDTEVLEQERQKLQDLRTEEHQESLSMLEKYREKIFGVKKESTGTQAPSKFARMVMVALGLHAVPLAPEAARAFESMVRQVEKAAPKMILRPQSMEDMVEIEKRKNEREARSDPKHVEATKKEMRERIARGEEPSLKDEYFALERDKGVDPGTVERGKKQAEDRIQKYSVLVDPHHQLDPKFLKQFVGEMYGSEDNYEWGQASVSTYFDTGKRNCVSVAKGEAIVLEGVLQNMDPEIRKHYELGIKKIKNHEIATLTYRADDGKVTSYELEGGVTERNGSAEEPGSKVIPLKELKKSMVAEKPTVLKAAEGNVKESPTLITNTDQPVDDGIVVEGDLKGSDFVMQEAEREGIKPTVMKEVLQDKPIEVEILSDGTTEEEATAEVKDLVNTLSVDPTASGPMSLRNIHNPSNTVVETLEREILKTNGKVNGYYVEQLKDWTPEAVERLLLSPVEEVAITFGSRKTEDQLVKQISDAAEGMGASARPAAKRVVLGSWDSGSSANFSKENFRKLVDAFNNVDEIKIGATVLHSHELEELKDSNVRRLDLSNVSESDVTSTELLRINHPDDEDKQWRFIQRVGQIHKEIILDGQFYVTELILHPELAEMKNVKPNFHNLELAVLGTQLNILQAQKDPRFKAVTKQAEDEMELRKNQGYQ